MEVLNHSLVKMTFPFHGFPEDTTKRNKQGKTQYLRIIPRIHLNRLPDYHVDIIIQCLNSLFNSINCNRIDTTN